MLARGWDILRGDIAVVLLIAHCAVCWKVDFSPRSRISVLEESDVVRFKPAGDKAQLGAVLSDSDALFVGARDVFYKLNLTTLSPIKILSWPVEKSAYQTCRTGYQKSENECRNHIRVLAKWTNGRVLICGTNALKPLCRYYKNSPHYDFEPSRSGVTICPYRPNDPHSFNVVGETIYSATYADMQSTDPGIFNGNIRTKEYDTSLFNEPHFVTSLEHEDNVFFLFRETAKETINCGKKVYSRIARVCKSDMGGETILSGRFTSFLKARLNCSVPWGQEFSFDEIADSSDIGRGNLGATLHTSDRQDMFYALFNTPENSITGSAICAFRLSDVNSVFKTQCERDSQKVSDAVLLNYLKSDPLMSETVPALQGRPLYIQTELRSRMTTLAVDWQVPAADGKYYDVLYIGTDEGRVLKAYNRHSRLGNDSDAVVIESVQVTNSAITSLKIRGQNGRRRLIAASKEQIVSLALQRCNSIKTCSGCLKLQDPHCSWTKLRGCTNSGAGIQDLVSGDSKGRCPPEIESVGEEVSVPKCEKCQKCRNTDDNVLPTTETVQENTPIGNTKNNKINNNVFAVGASSSGPNDGVAVFTILMAVMATFIVTAILFSIIGYCIAKRKANKLNSNLKFLDKLSDTAERSKRDNVSNYVQTPGPKPLNVLMNVAPKIPNKYTVPSPVPEHKSLHLPMEHKTLDKSVISQARKAYV